VTDTVEKTPLRAARERTGLSRETVVRRLDPPISTKTLERMENGLAPLKGFRLKQLAAIYEVPISDLAA
jgi:transcriptional regulator with XRE-family HTH domain